MHFSSTLITLAAALSTVTMANPVVRANTATCKRGNVLVAFRYEITAPGIGDVAGVCNGLWDNLKASGKCASPSLTICDKNSHGDLFWEFNIPVTCSSNLIENAFNAATSHINYKHVHC